MIEQLIKIQDEHVNEYILEPSLDARRAAGVCWCR
jgi:hypothetical protein